MPLGGSANSVFKGKRLKFKNCTFPKLKIAKTSIGLKIGFLRLTKGKSLKENTQNSQNQPFSKAISALLGKTRTIFTPCSWQRPYHVEHTSSRPITEVKQRWVQSVLGWVTAWEHWMLLALLFPHFRYNNILFN